MEPQFKEIINENEFFSTFICALHGMRKLTKKVGSVWQFEEASDLLDEDEDEAVSTTYFYEYENKMYVQGFGLSPMKVDRMMVKKSGNVIFLQIELRSRNPNGYKINLRIEEVQQTNQGKSYTTYRVQFDGADQFVTDLGILFPKEANLNLDCPKKMMNVSGDLA